MRTLRPINGAKPFRNSMRGPLLTLTMRLQWEGLPAVRAYRVDSIMVREEQELAGQIPLFGNPSVLELRL